MVPTRSLEAGFKPHIIIGDFDSCSERALQCGAELVAHERGDGFSPARDVLDATGLPFTTITAPGMSEDVAMLLAYEAGAELIVAVGTHAYDGRVPRQGSSRHGFHVPHASCAWARFSSTRRA